MFHMIRRRYEKGSLIITSNQPVGSWGEVLGDPVVATAVLDRLLHHSNVLTIKGDSYRLKEKRRAGVIPIREGEVNGTSPGGLSSATAYGLRSGQPPGRPPLGGQ